MERLLAVLYKHGKLKKTVIARYTNLSYDKNVRYLICLEMLDFIKRQKDDDDFELFDLTTSGMSFCKRKLDGKSELHSKYEENILLE